MSEKSGRQHTRLWKVLIGVGVSILVVALGLGAFLLATESQRREDRNLEIVDVDFSKVPDGTYLGSYRGWNKFDVLVTVSGGQVTKIRIAEDSPTPATKVTEGVLERIVNGQSLGVDAVSGATVTTNGLLKAVENALVSQRTE